VTPPRAKWNVNSARVGSPRETQRIPTGADIQNQVKMKGRQAASDASARYREGASEGVTTMMGV